MVGAAQLEDADASPRLAVVLDVAQFDDRVAGRRDAGI
jgi:hypothetical protein